MLAGVQNLCRYLFVRGIRRTNKNSVALLEEFFERIGGAARESGRQPLRARPFYIEKAFDFDTRVFRQNSGMNRGDTSCSHNSDPM
jgi:hypothetical protein